VLFKVFEFVITNLMKHSNPIFNVYYILQYPRLDVRRDLVYNIHCIVIYKAKQSRYRPGVAQGFQKVKVMLEAESAPGP